MRYVIVGSGNIAKTWVGALAALDFPLVGVVSRSGRRPEGTSGEPPVFASVPQVEVDFDAVIVTTPNGLHRGPVVEAATLGKHALTEKPLDITREAMAAMIGAHEAAGTVLAVSYQRRTQAHHRALKALLDARAFGRVVGADLSCRFWRDQSYYDSADWRGTRAVDGGGPFLQQVIHDLDLYLWFFGVPDEVVGRTATFLHDIEVEDHGAALLVHPGMIGTVVGSTCARPGYRSRLEVTTEVGGFTLEDGRITVWDVVGVARPGAAPTPGSANTAAVADVSGHKAILADFEEAVATGRAPLVPGREAALATELALAIYGR